MKKLALVPLLWLSLASASFAQTTFTMPPPAGVTVMGVQVVQTCANASITVPAVAYVTMDHTGALCTASSGGGGGGLSVTDQTAFVQGTSAFTPSGGVFNDSATLPSGQEGTYRLTTKRAQIVDVDPTGNQLHADIISPINAQAGTAPSTQTPVTTGNPVKMQSDLNGNIYVNQNLQATLAGGSTFVKGTTAAMTGTSPTQILAAVTSKVLYVTAIKCNNSSATGTLVQITDGSAGTVIETLAAGATFGGEARSGVTPLFWTTSGNGLFAQDVTTGASVICTSSGYSG